MVRRWLIGGLALATMTLSAAGCGGSSSSNRSNGSRAKSAGHRVPIDVIMQKGQALATVSLKIHGRGPYVFVVDTGASGSVIDRDTAKALGLPVRGKPSRVTGVSCGGTGVKVAIDGWSAEGTALPAAMAVSTPLALPPRPTECSAGCWAPTCSATSARCASTTAPARSRSGRTRGLSRSARR